MSTQTLRRHVDKLYNKRDGILRAVEYLHIFLCVFFIIIWKPWRAINLQRQKTAIKKHIISYSLYFDSSFGSDKSMEGNLYKWTNYWNGWQQRYFVLKEGILTYYNNKEESKNGGCKRSFKISMFDIIGNKSATMSNTSGFIMLNSF